jgi:MraZ protein
MPLFLSTYVNRMDKKGRVSVPAPFRAALAGQNFQGVVLFRAANHACVEGFDYQSMAELSERLEHFDLFSAEQDDLATTIFAEAVQCPFDGEGRISIPVPLLSHARIGESLTFVGMGRKFQIWDSETFEKRRDAARMRVSAEKLTLPGAARSDRHV